MRETVTGKGTKVTAQHKIHGVIKEQVLEAIVVALGSGKVFLLLLQTIDVFDGGLRRKRTDCESSCFASMEEEAVQSFVVQSLLDTCL